MRISSPVESLVLVFPDGEYTAADLPVGIPMSDLVALKHPLINEELQGQPMHTSDVFFTVNGSEYTLKDVWTGGVPTGAVLWVRDH